MSADPNYKAWHNAYTAQHKHWPHGETSWQAGRDFEREKAQSILQAKEAEIAALKEDAARYRWLRHGDNDEKVLMVYETNGSRPFDHRYDEAWLPRNEALDAAIDSARAAGVGEGTR